MRQSKSSSPLTVIDLFAGGGGLSLGACRAGFNLVASVEIDKAAIDCHTLNFPNTIHLNQDVSVLTGRELEFQTKIDISKIDGIIGGPPCQGFSTIGKRKENDYRNSLFSHFFRIISEYKPKFFIAENVPGILNEKYKDLLSQAFSLVKDEYKILAPMLIDASLYGAPTIRKRIFFVGIRKDIHINIDQHSFLPPKSIQKTNVKKALQGLPIWIDENSQSFDSSWKKIEVVDEKDYFFKRIYGLVPDKVGDKQSLNRYKKLREVSGFLGTRHSVEIIKRYDSLLPGQTDKISKSMRLDPNQFCPTLRAGTGKEHGSFQAVRPIHPTEPRVITPREAARLQGFPDWFQFDATKWHSFRLIGNSVSPIVSEHILRVLYNNLREMV